ncbi:MAG: hypothetical protein HY565_03820, partial [Candidatus Kerfeldbacteria bacterium]|nr:hypothetical protein [Candidatus Kerfeldbacteria bacterium]
MIRRWNLTIIIIITAFVLGVVSGYTYRDRFSRLSLQQAKLDRTEPDISQDIFRTEVAELLTPKTSVEATTGVDEVYAFTGRIIALTTTLMTVEQPNETTPTLDAIDFILTDTTSYKALTIITDVNGLPGSVEADLTQSELSIGDIVTVYTVEDIVTATERHVVTVQR